MLCFLRVSIRRGEKREERKDRDNGVAKKKRMRRERGKEGKEKMGKNSFFLSDVFSGKKKEFRRVVIKQRGKETGREKSGERE